MAPPSRSWRDVRCDRRRPAHGGPGRPGQPCAGRRRSHRTSRHEREGGAMRSEWLVEAHLDVAESPGGEAGEDVVALHPSGVRCGAATEGLGSVSYTHLRAHETVLDLVCRLLL